MKKLRWRNTKIVLNRNWTTGHRIQKQDNTVIDDDYYFNKGDEHFTNQETVKKLQAMIRRYKKQAYLHLENVSKGLF